jgi:hypothetical protein
MSVQVDEATEGSPYAKSASVQCIDDARPVKRQGRRNALALAGRPQCLCDVGTEARYEKQTDQCDPECRP